MPNCLLCTRVLGIFFPFSLFFLFAFPAMRSILVKNANSAIYCVCCYALKEKHLDEFCSSAAEMVEQEMLRKFFLLVRLSYLNLN